MAEATNRLSLEAMLEKFGVVTVMDVEFYETKRWSLDEILDAKDATKAASLSDYQKSASDYAVGEWDACGTLCTENSDKTLKAKKPVVYLDTLKITNINAEGPNKTATGGSAADVLLKYGKKFTIEMQDAMGRYGALENLYGAHVAANKQILAITDRFPGEYTLVGTTFVVDQATGAKQPLKIVVPVFLGDGIFNLTQDAEGDVTVFDLNGDVLRFEKEGFGSVSNLKYAKGADNSFYFFATEDGFAAVQQKGYRKAMEAAVISVDTTTGEATLTGASQA